MTRSEAETLGGLIQAYARALREGRRDAEENRMLAARLGRALSDRIEVLGVDAERLLAADPERVLTELGRLEREAALEDAGGGSRRFRERTRPGTRFHD